MATPDILSIPTILQIGKLAQALAANDIAIQKVLKGDSLDDDLPSKIYIERMAVQNRYDLNPSDPTLRATATYLFQLLGAYGLQAQNLINGAGASAPIVSGPSNQTVALGGTATFTVSVTATLLFTIAWYKAGILVPGQTGNTYSFVPTLGESGETINAVISYSGGSVLSAVATLTVTNSLIASYFYGDTDYSAALMSGTDNISYNGTVSIVNGQPISVPYPLAAANNKFNGIRYPVSQGIKTIWFNTPLNQGAVPDSVMRSVITIGSFYYIISRNAMSLDTSSPVIYS